MIAMGIVAADAVATEYLGAQKGDLIYGFIESIVTGTPGEITTDDVFDAMSVCLAIEKAADEGRTVEVEYL